jgi:hypothetical protein
MMQLAGQHGVHAFFSKLQEHRAPGQDRSMHQAGQHHATILYTHILVHGG